MGGHGGRRVQEGLQVVQTRKAVVLTEGWGWRQVGTLTSQAQAMTSSQESPGCADAKAPGMDRENDPKVQPEPSMRRERKGAETLGHFQDGRSTITWDARDVPAPQHMGSASSSSSPQVSSVLTGAPQAHHEAKAKDSGLRFWFGHIPWRPSGLRDFCSTSKRDGSLAKKIKQSAPCLALIFPEEADVSFKDFGRHLCTRDMKTTERESR